MSAPTRVLRRASIIFVALGSAACAVFLIWRFVSVEQIGAVPTAHLVGVLGLFVLPAATLAGLEIDRRMVRAGGAAAREAERARAAMEARSHAPDGAGARRSGAGHRAARPRPAVGSRA